MSISNFLFFLLFFCTSVIQSDCKGELKILDETSWAELLTGEWMVEFYAPWCPACQQLKPIWEEFAKWSDDLGIKVGNADITNNPGLSGRFMITALPTIFHVKDGIFRQYRGGRDKESFFSFVEEKKWQTLDPIPSWKSPNTYQMATVAQFFKLSMLLRSLHTTMVQDYGFHDWVSYLIFGLATILIGTLLGLIIVCILDYFCNSKSPAYDRVHDKEKDERSSKEEYQGEDVIKEDLPEDSELRKRKET